MNIPAIDSPSQIKRGITVDSRNFLFSLVHGAGASGDLSSSGAKSVTLTPVPVGINSTDLNHYVYISSGTGTPEAVLITGGTAVSGAASGILTFTTVNTHTGAWSITSATAGIAEALS